MLEKTKSFLVFHKAQPTAAISHHKRSLFSPTDDRRRSLKFLIDFGTLSQPKLFLIQHQVSSGAFWSMMHINWEASQPESFAKAKELQNLPFFTKIILIASWEISKLCNDI